MSSQGNDESSQRNDDETRRVDAAAGAAAAAEDHPRTQHPPQPAPNDMMGLLGGMLPQAMGLLNQMMGGEGGGARMGEHAASGGAANAQAQGDPRAPHVAAGVDRVLEVLQQQQRLWEDMGDRMDQSAEERRRRAEAAGQHGNIDPLAAFLGQLGGAPAAAAAAHPPQQQQQQQQDPLAAFIGQVLGPLQQGGQPLPQRAAEAAAPRPQQQQQQIPLAGMIGQLGGVLDELQQIVDEQQPQRPAAAAYPPRPPPQQPQQQPVSLARMIGQIAGVLGGLEHRMQPPAQQPAAAAAGSPPRPQQQQHSPPVPDWRDVMAAVRAGADMATAAAAAGPAAGQAPPTLNFADLITTAASGLAGGAAPRAGGDPPGQSFEERLRAATERGEPSVPGGAAAPHPPPPMQLPGQILQLPRAFGGARIEIHGLPDNLGDVFARLRGWEQGQPGGGGGAVASRVPEEHLRLLPNSAVKQTHVDDQKQCFICMDTYTQVGEPVAEMTCGHIFHSPCIVPWLQANSTCPVCRAEVVSRNWVHDQFDLD